MSEAVTFAGDEAAGRSLLRRGRVALRVGQVVMRLCLVALLLVVFGAAVYLLVDAGTARVLASRLLPPVALVLGVGQGLSVLGRGLVHNGTQLLGLVIRVDAEGVSWTGTHASHADWHDIGHVAISPAKPGRRRLRLVNASSPVADHHLRASVLPAFWRRAFGLDAFALDVPVDKLTISAGAAVDAIRHASGGRFPDIYPRGASSTPAT